MNFFPGSEECWSELEPLLSDPVKAVVLAAPEIPNPQPSDNLKYYGLTGTTRAEAIQALAELMNRKPYFLSITGWASRGHVVQQGDSWLAYGFFRIKSI